VTITTAVSGYWESTSLVKSIPDSPGMFTSLRTSAIGISLRVRLPAAALSAVMQS
jgi:hypothetical protein